MNQSPIDASLILRSHFFLYSYVKNFNCQRVSKYTCSFWICYFYFYFFILNDYFIYLKFLLLPNLPFSSLSPPISPSLALSPKSSQGTLLHGKTKVLPTPSRYIKLSIQTDQAPTMSVHAIESKPSAIVLGISVSPHCQPHSEGSV